MINSISIVFPAFNEEKNITRAINYAVNYCSTNFNNYEILIINDGSTDRTKKVVEKLITTNPHIKLINNEVNLGYGQTIWRGLKAASKDYVFFTDSDLQFDIKEINKLIPYLSEYDVVLGYRHKRKDNFLRKLNGKLWTLLTGIFLGVWVKDVDCAFKIFKKSILNDLVIKSGGATFSPELLMRIKFKHIPWKQVPVSHFSRREGKQTGANIKVIFRAIKELVKLTFSEKNILFK